MRGSRWRGVYCRAVCGAAEFSIEMSSITKCLHWLILFPGHEDGFLGHSFAVRSNSWFDPDRFVIDVWLSEQSVGETGVRQSMTAVSVCDISPKLMSVCSDR